MRTFRAYRMQSREGATGPRGEFVDLALDDLSAGEVVVRVAYCAINHKAALAHAGTAGLVRNFPRIGGAEIVGTVETSDDPRYAPGDRVQNTGTTVGVDHDGGFAQYARLRGDWLLKMPADTDLFEAAAIGGNGLCAAASIHRMEHDGLHPEAGPVVVTGATGGVSTLAIEMLSRLGYTVAALTGKPEAAALLVRLGATEVIDASRLEMGRRPLESARWAGAIDSVGGEVLGWLTRTMRLGGVIASVGNAGGRDLNTTVLPFILRGVTLIGMAAYPFALREQLWARIRDEMRPRHLAEYTQVIPLEQTPEYLERMLARRTQGRILVAPWS